MRELAREVVAIAADGLSRRAALNAAGDNESGFLDPLHEVIASGQTPADRLLERFHNEWGGDVSRIYQEMSF
jgi:glutamate--cysteine ligase